MTLAEVVKAHSNNPKQSMLQNIREAEMKENMFIVESHASTVSLGSATYHYGYQEVYE